MATRDLPDIYAHALRPIYIRQILHGHGITITYSTTGTKAMRAFISGKILSGHGISNICDLLSKNPKSLHDSEFFYFLNIIIYCV